MQKRNRFILPILITGVIIVLLISIFAVYFFLTCGCFDRPHGPLSHVTTRSGTENEFGEPFGIAVRSGEIYVSDGLKGTIWKLKPGAKPIVFATGFNTPSAISFTSNGDLIVADTGSHTIRKVDKNGTVKLVAGTENQAGDLDGPALSARFNGPVGLTVLDDDTIVVADTYNDKIKVIRNGSVSTLAGSARGFVDGTATNAMFDTPCGVAAASDGRILVADTLNSRIRIINKNGIVSTLTGNGESESSDGTLFTASFYKPAAVALGPDGSIFVSDGNAVRAILSRPLPIVETLTDTRLGYIDGPAGRARFNRISGIAITEDYEVILADSNNAAVRELSSIRDEKASPKWTNRARRTDPAEFRTRQPARWPFDPPLTPRDVAGTLGEIRGEAVDETSRSRFHNGLDIAGAYGEPARFIRDERVLDPVSAENFGTLRELIRLPEIGYIHIRLGRDSANKPFRDERFLFNNEMDSVRVRRGTHFRAGEIIGTLNAMNHVHMIAGPSGDEMNALDALILPGVADMIPPVIEKIEFFDQNWRSAETEIPGARINLTGSSRVVVRAFDRMDGNPERRRLGIFRLGYQVLNSDRSPLTETSWNISFDRNPSPEAAKFAYSRGSKSGPTGETIFRYIISNKVSGNDFSEGFLEYVAVFCGRIYPKSFRCGLFWEHDYKRHQL